MMNTLKALMEKDNMQKWMSQQREEDVKERVKTMLEIKTIVTEVTKPSSVD